MIRKILSITFSILTILVFFPTRYRRLFFYKKSTVHFQTFNGVMRAVARLVLQLPRNSHIRLDMKDKLHWLDFPACSIFKLCVTAYRCQQGQAPTSVETHHSCVNNTWMLSSAISNDWSSSGASM